MPAVPLCHARHPPSVMPAIPLQSCPPSPSSHARNPLLSFPQSPFCHSRSFKRESILPRAPGATFPEVCFDFRLRIVD